MLKSFEQLDSENGGASLFKDYAAVSQSPDFQGYKPAPAPTLGETMVAAVNQYNTVGSMLSRKDAGVGNYDDGSFNPVQYIKDNKLDGYEDTFAPILNRRLADMTRDQINMENDNKRTLDASGWTGTAAALAAGVFDLPTLIPGSVAVRGVKGGWEVGKSMLMAGASAMATQAGTEALLQTSQQTRTAGESVVNIGAAAVIGSLLGGGVASVLSKNDHITMERALSNMADINSGEKPNRFLTEGEANSGGAAVNPDTQPKIIDTQKSREDLTVDGNAAGVVAKYTNNINPFLRSTQRYAATARQLGSTMYRNTVYRAMHGAGETVGPSVEAMAGFQVEAQLIGAFKPSEAAYLDMVKSGVRMSKDDFYNAVGTAMRNNDESDNSFVARAAKAYRGVSDHFTKRGLDTGLLKEEDLDVKTAASYLSRYYNRDVLEATEPQFLDQAGKHYAELMQGAHAEDAAKLTQVRAQYRQRTEDLNLTGAERSQRIDELKARGAALDANNAHLNDHVDAISEGISALRAGDQSAREAIKKAKEAGGEPLQQYLQARGELRARVRNLTERNPDAQLAKGEYLTQRVDNVQEFTERSLSAYARQAKNLINQLDANPERVAEEKIAELTNLAHQAEAKLQRTQEYVGKLKERGDMASNADFWSGRIAKQQQALSELTDLVNMHTEAGPAFAKARVQKLEELLSSITESQAQRDLRRGGQLKVMQDRAEKLSPDAVKERAAALGAKHFDILKAHEERFDARWGDRKAAGIENNEPYDFAAAGRETAKKVYNSITGRDPERDLSVPSFVTKIKAGPMKDRVVMLPDEMLARNNWLHSDVRVVMNRYARAMAGEIELTRRFGSADMGEQFKAMGAEYSSMREAVDKATSVAEINSILGSKQYRSKLDLAKVKLDAQKKLSNDETSAMTDAKAGRDSLRGDYLSDVNGTNFASITRGVMGLNYMRMMGGVLVPNIGDFYRPAMVHGLGLYMKHIPGLMAQTFGNGSKGLGLALKEAEMSGLLSNRVGHFMMQANGDVLDPFIGKATQFERFMDKGSKLASRWNLVNVFTDAQQAMSSILSQHRILEAVLGNSGDGTFLHTDGERLIRMLGIDKNTQADIAKLYAAHGETLDGYKIPNTDKWLNEAHATGNAKEIARVENAVDTYRAALYTDVNSVVSKRGLGDTPLLAHHPLGKLLTQFSGYTMGAHSNVTIRGLQESPARLVGGLTALTIIGAMTSYISAWRNGQDRWQKYLQDTAANPSLLIGEGLDRSGFFPLLFDLSNRTERVAGSVGYNYKFNPIKSPIATLGGGAPAGGITSSRGSDSAGAWGALLGPTAGMMDSGIAALRVGADYGAGQKSSKRDVNQALAAIPFQSYYGVRELLQVMTGNSPYLGK